MYKVYNGNLLFHGCIPMEEDGSFAKVNIYGKEYSGKALFDILETYVRKAFFSDDRLLYVTAFLIIQGVQQMVQIIIK